LTDTDQIHVSNAIVLGQGSHRNAMASSDARQRFPALHNVGVPAGHQRDLPGAASGK
jgi:hypothetical protein